MLHPAFLRRRSSPDGRLPGGREFYGSGHGQITGAARSCVYIPTSYGIKAVFSLGIFMRITRILSLLATAFFVPAIASAQSTMPRPLPAEILADAPDKMKADWLRAHIVAQGKVAGGMSFAFPKGFYRSRLILLGESHGVAAPQGLDLELLTHLNQRIGLVYYLAEIDPVQADYFNRYLETGDEVLLKRVFDHWTNSGAQWGNRAFEDKVRAIRSLNATLPAARRIRFVGIDSVQDWRLVGEWIAGPGEPPAGILAAKAANDRASAALTALGEKPGHVAAELRATLADISAGQQRETVIFNNYARAVRGGKLGNRPAYGLWGLYHVMQAGVNKTQPFAARVAASDLPAASKIASIALLSLDSAVQIPVPFPDGVKRLRLTNFNIDGPFVMVKGAATLRAASEPATITLFDTGARGSPIAATDFGQITTSVGQGFVPDDPGPQARRLVQYVGVFRDSDWAAPRE